MAATGRAILPQGSESPSLTLSKIGVLDASRFIEEYLARNPHSDQRGLIEFPGEEVLGAAELLELQEEMVEDLAGISWGSLVIPNPTTASLEAVAQKIPYYILKAVGKQRAKLVRSSRLDNPSGTRLAYRTCRVLFHTLQMLLRLSAYSASNILNFTVDDVGGYYRKGVKRGAETWSTREPGEGGEYEYEHESSDEDDSDSESTSSVEDYTVEMEDNSQIESLSAEFDRLSIHPDLFNTSMRFTSQLNGSHGEWTGSDDVKSTGKGKARNRGGGSNNTVTRKRKTAVGRVAGVVRATTKNLVRNKGIKTLGLLIGEQNARGGYQKVARTLRPKELVLSDSASKYLLSFVKPFDNSVAQCYIPRPPATRSFKVTGFVRGAGAIGANGFGFIAVSPTLCNDRPCAWFTTSVYTPTVLGAPPSDIAYTNPLYSAGGLKWPASTTMSNLPYSTAQLTATAGGTGSTLEISGRIVSCCLRVYYTGTALSEAGNYYAYADPDVNNVLGGDHTSGADPTGYNTAQLLSKDATEIIKVKGRSEASLVRVCTDPNMDDYPRAAASALRKVYPYCGGEYYTNSADNIIGCANFVIALDGTASQPFYFEIVTHTEYIGTGVVQGLLSDTNNDAVGYDCVKNILQHAQRMVATNPRMTFQQCVSSEMSRQGVRMGRGQRSVDY